MEGVERIISTVHLDSPREISAAHRPREEEEERTGEVEEAYGDEEFEFAFVPRDPGTGEEFSADEIFSKGRIRPAYPVFGRVLQHDEVASEAVWSQLAKLGMEDRSGSVSSSECDELDGIPEGSYCVWVPRSVPQSPNRCPKSSSTGSAGRRWRLRDLVVGRSRSDGKERFVFLGSPGAEDVFNAKPKAKAKAEDAKTTTMKKKGGKVSQADVVTVHRTYYAKGTQAPRRSYLPYRPELVGLFGSGNRLGRTRYPF